MGNLDGKTVAGFADEWTRFDQSALPEAESRVLFEQYFGLFPWHRLPPGASGFDLGCGSGRWARWVAPRVGTLHCLDAGEATVRVARRNLDRRQFPPAGLAGGGRCCFVVADVDALPLPDSSMDFGYALGVLHHVPETAAGIRACVDKLKPGAPLLLYLYYAFDNRPAWFRALWRMTDVLRRGISRLPFRLRYWVSSAVALGVYFPLARAALLLEAAGVNVAVVPLSAYRRRSFYTMRTDALDRFGTRLEQRFTRQQIREMMHQAGLQDIAFSETVYWCAVGVKRQQGSGESQARVSPHSDADER